MATKLSKETMEMIEQGARQWEKTMGKILKEDFDEFEFYVLKCHLIVEHEIIAYIEKRTFSRITLADQGFSFSQKIKICKMLGCFDGLPDFEDFATCLNSLRNQIAHKLAYDKKHIKTLMQIAKKYAQDKSAELKPEKHVFDGVLASFAGILLFKSKIDTFKDTFKVLNSVKTEDWRDKL